MVTIKSADEQQTMREGGKILATILAKLKNAVKPGVTRKEIDNLAKSLCVKYKVQPSFKGYGGYPASVCVSVNDEVVHGLPTEAVFKEGDLVSLDMGVLYKGFHTDSASSFICRPSTLDIAQDDNKLSVAKKNKAEDLIKVCEQSLYSGINLIKDGVHLGDVSAKIQEIAETHGYGVIRMLVGHGIGREVHEDPHVPNYGTAGTGSILKTGMTLAIEPMITADGSIDVVLADDGWTYKSHTGALCAHVEHTVLVTDDGYEILTQ